MNSAPANPNDPRPDDIARPGPTDPATGQPDHGAEVGELKSWFRENRVSLVVTAVAVTLVCVYLDPIDTLKVVIGLGFIIFIHELGHFLAAKWCDVHVSVFSIGFGPAVPFCSYKYGETTYMVGVIPLGGYVKMVGENEEEDDDDPRSFRKKTVGQRMVIISAGVVMNIIFGLACFTAAYLHGVEEAPARVGFIESGGAGWRAGMRTGDTVTQIASRQSPTFNDLKPIVMSSRKDEQVPLTWKRGEAETATHVSPIRDEGQKFPQIGIGPPSKLTLQSGNKRKVRATFPGTPAAAAEPKFEPGDRIVEMSDDADPAQLTPVATFEEYHKRMVRLAARDITFKVQRKGSDDTATIVVKPTYRHDLGLRMRMGEVVALRAHGTAKDKIEARKENPAVPGDRIRAVLLPPGADGKRLWYVAGSVDWSKDEFKFAGVGPAQVDVQPLDPLLLPRQLNAWADRNGLKGKTPVHVVVLRTVHHQDNTPVRVEIDYDPSFRLDREMATQPNSPLPLSALGLAYWVEGVVDEVTPGGPAAAAGVRVNDTVTAVRFKAPDENGGIKAGPWNDELKPYQWASADSLYQLSGPELDIKVKRGESETVEMKLTGVPATAWPLDDRGFIFQSETQVQKAEDIAEAMRLGGQRTMRFVKTVYMNLYAMVIGRVSAKTMNGPLSIANVSYKLAGEDFWFFLLFLGMISVNLAVVNFLPIPVLDGGHMVFLILEKILGRPVPERLFAIAMYTGLFLILGLMLFVLTLDVGRLFFGVFG